MMRRYYEFAVAVILIGVLALFLLRSLADTRLAMEEATVQSVAAAMRIELVEVVAHREMVGGVLPSSRNPVDWVTVKPVNYLGQRDTLPDETSVWYFDTQAGELVYRFRDQHRARFRLTREGGVGQGRAVIAGVGLIRLDDRAE